MKLDLDNVNDGLYGRWWNYIDCENFVFQKNVPENDVKNDDILIHKEIKEGETFPTLRYHTILDNEVLEIDGKIAREMLSTKLKEFILKHKKIPYSIVFNKIQKNGLVIFKYSPTKFDNYQLKKTVTDFGFELDEAEEFFKNIENMEGTPVDGELKINIMPDNPIIENIASESGANRVYIFNAEVKEMEKRSSEYMGHVSEFYILELQNGEAAPDNKKNTMRRDFDRVIVKISEKTLIAADIKVGDSVSLSGKTKMNFDFKFIIQNVRKITKNEE
jgi:hypothetical protein